MAFDEVGVTLEFSGDGVDEKGTIASVDKKKFEDATGINSDKIIKRVGQDVLFIDPTYFRPTEVDILIGDPTKSKQQLGWEPKYDLKMLVEDMVSSDLQLFKRNILLKKGGFDILQQAE
jgi:GDPmannose 4,6-dehydratase